MSDAADYLDRAQIEAMILAKVVEDPAFGARLKADPKAALAEMFETKLPAELNIHVFQETPSDLMIRLPIVASDEVSEEELAGVAGGRGAAFRALGKVLVPVAITAAQQAASRSNKRW